MSKLYTSIPAPRVPRNLFKRSRPNSLTMPFQRCVPTLFEEILPGDQYRVGQEIFARLQPMIAPVMNNMKLSMHYFYVPLRTINKHFAEFMFNNRQGNYDEVLPYTHTDILFELVDELNDGQYYAEAAEVIRLFDFIGLPFRYSSKTTAALFVSGWLADTYNIQVAAAKTRVNLAPFIAYQKVWSEYFRDENVEDDPFEILEGDTGIDVFDWTGDVDADIHQVNVSMDPTQIVPLFRLRPRAWAHDRFTSCLPFAQRGPDVLLPIAGTAEVKYKDGFLKGDVSPFPQTNMVTVGGNPQVETKRKYVAGAYSSTAPAGNPLKFDAGSNDVSGGSRIAYDPNGSLYADMTNADLTTTINSFRRAERLQRWYENSARGGVRPNEATLAHFGVKTPDASLDRAEFLGGTKQPIVVSEVAQTSETTASSPQGTLAGKGTSYNGAVGFKRFFTEHGFVIGITSAIVRANYWQGMPKMFSRMQRDEYYWPEFANLGEEPVFTKELYLSSNVAEDTVFGYVPRYSDYKTAVGECHGDMRSSLDFWTQTREFANVPQLNKQFLFGDPSLSPFAVQSLYSDPIIVTIHFNVSASRLMPYYGVPTI